MAVCHASDLMTLYLLPLQLRVYTEVKVTSSRSHSAKVLSTPFGNSVVADVVALLICGNRGIQRMPCCFRIIKEMLPENHKMN